MPISAHPILKTITLSMSIVREYPPGYGVAHSATDNQANGEVHYGTGIFISSLTRNHATCPGHKCVSEVSESGTSGAHSNHS